MIKDKKEVIQAAALLSHQQEHMEGWVLQYK